VGSRNRELDLGTRIRRGPESESPADHCRALAHPAQPEVFPTSLLPQELRIDALAVIPDAQLELSLVVLELDLNACRPGMSICVAQRFTRDPIDLITYDRLEFSWRAFDPQAQRDEPLASRSRSKLLADALDGIRQIVGLDCRGSQSLHGVAAIGERLFRLVHGAFEHVLRFRRARRK